MVLFSIVSSFIKFLFFTFSVLCVDKIALAGILPCATIAMGFETQTVIFSSSGKMTSICPTKDVVPRGTSVVILSTTEHSVAVDLFPNLSCKVICLKSLSRSVDADRSGGRISLDIFDRRSAGMIRLEKRFG